MRTPKEIAVDIHNGDTKAKAELEKMMGKNFNDMTIEERRLGVVCLSAFEEQWNKQEGQPMTPKDNRGGKREGAGRKPSGKKKRNYYVTDEEHEAIKKSIEQMRQS